VAGPEVSTAARVDARGRLRVVPLAGALAGGLAYARPEYRVGTDAAPALARVVGLVGDTARIGASSAAVLAPAAVAPGDAPAPEGDALTRARQLYLDSRAALRRGDWAGVGRALDALGAALGAGGGAAGASPGAPAGTGATP
jgi:hypothetical protein